MSRVRFTIDVDIEEKWVDDFCSFLKYIQFCGDVKQNSVVGFHADGSKGFKANFGISRDFSFREGELNVLKNTLMKDSKLRVRTTKGEIIPYMSCFNVDRVFDAE